jgi:hypothetical protein
MKRILAKGLIPIIDKNLEKSIDVEIKKYRCIHKIYKWMRDMSDKDDFSRDAGGSDPAGHLGRRRQRRPRGCRCPRRTYRRAHQRGGGDSGGNLAFLRMPGAFLQSIDIAIDKAYTAAGFGFSTRTG